MEDLGSFVRRLVLFTTVAGAIGAPSVQAQTCGDTYLSQNDPTELIEVVTSTNPFTFNTVGAADVRYNAMAYRPADDTLYAIQVQGNTLLEVSLDGSLNPLGEVTDLPTNAGNYLAGAFGDDGLMYVRSTGNASTWFSIDVDSLTATQLDLSAPADVNDVSWFDGLLYGVDVSDGMLKSIDPGTGSVTAIGEVGVNPRFGAMLSASNGIFGVNNDGIGAFQFDATTGEATLISDAPGSGNNDGARCLNAALEFEADLTMTKTDDSETYSPGTDVTYDIVVTNNGPFGVQNAQVEDPLPDGISTAIWTCSGADGGVCGADSGSGALVDTPDLPVGASVSYAFTVTIPEDRTGELSNTATAALPEGFTDPTPDDASATDVDESDEPGEPVPALPPLAFVLLVLVLAASTLWTLRRAHA